MRTRRALLACALGALALSPGAAEAAAKPKPVCNIVPDPEGDGRSQAISSLPGGGNTPSSAALDILGADFATGGQTIVAVMKLKSLDKDVFNTHRARYSFTFRVGGGDTYTFYLDQSLDSPENTYIDPASGDNLPANSKFDRAKNTLTFTASKSVVRIKPGSKIDQLSAKTYAFGTNADVASNPTYLYPDRHPSCLAPK